MKSWKTNFKNVNLDSFPSEKLLNNLIPKKNLPNLSLTDIGFKKSKQIVRKHKLSPNLIRNYEKSPKKMGLPTYPLICVLALLAFEAW